MSAHIVWGCITLVALILIVDWAVGTFEKWRKRRDEFIRNEELKRFCITPMFGTKKCDDPRWPS